MLLICYALKKKNNTYIWLILAPNARVLIEILIFKIQLCLYSCTPNIQYCSLIYILCTFLLNVTVVTKILMVGLYTCIRDIQYWLCSYKYTYIYIYINVL